MPVINNGQGITKRAFWHDAEELARTIPIKVDSVYRYMRELPPESSGRRSPMYRVCEHVIYLDGRDKATKSEISTAREYAEYPLLLWRQLQGENIADVDAVSKLNRLMCAVADANYKLGARHLESLTPAELKEFSQKMMDAAALSRELAVIADDVRRNIEARFPGAPFGHERLQAMR